MTTAEKTIGKAIGKAVGWAKRFAGARSAFSEIAQADADFRAEHKASQEEHDRIATSPGPLAEVLANIETAVTELASQWAKENGDTIIRSFAPGLEMQMDGKYTAKRPGLPDMFYGKSLTPVDLCRYLPGLVIERLRAVARAYHYTPGPAATDRWAALAAIDAKIAEIEDAHTELVDMAASLDPPLRLELLQVVAERRDREAEHAKRDAEEAERRRQIAAAANHRAGGASGGRSRYLETGKLQGQ